MVCAVLALVLSFLFFFLVCPFKSLTSSLLEKFSVACMLSGSSSKHQDINIDMTGPNRLAVWNPVTHKSSSLITLGSHNTRKHSGPSTLICFTHTKLFQEAMFSPPSKLLQFTTLHKSFHCMTNKKSTQQTKHSSRCLYGCMGEWMQWWCVADPAYSPLGLVESLREGGVPDKPYQGLLRGIWWGQKTGRGTMQNKAMTICVILFQIWHFGAFLA